MLSILIAVISVAQPQHPPQDTSIQRRRLTVPAATQIRGPVHTLATSGSVPAGRTTDSLGRQSFVDSLQRRIRQLEEARLSDSLTAASEIEVSSSRIRVKGVPIWGFAVVLVLTVGAGAVALRSTKEKVGLSFGLIAVIAVAVGCFLVGSWWARRSINKDLVPVIEMMRTRTTAVPLLREGVPAETAQTPRYSVDVNRSDSIARRDTMRVQAPQLFTQSMIWTIIIGSFLLVAALAVVLFFFWRTRMIDAAGRRRAEAERYEPSGIGASPLYKP